MNVQIEMIYGKIREYDVRLSTIAREQLALSVKLFEYRTLYNFAAKRAARGPARPRRAVERSPRS